MRNLWLFALVMIIAISCSGGNGPVLPTTDGETNLANTSQDTQSGRYLWGLYEWVIDLEAETCEFIPLRNASLHFNVVKDMNASAPRVGFEGFMVDKPNNTISLDVFLYHPYPGRPELAGFDVHGIMIGPGSVSGFDDPTLVMAGPNDPHIMNPDGWTRWWNPVEFNIGNNLFSYTDGRKGIPFDIGNYNATLNAYKTFSGDLGNDEDIAEMNIPDRLVFTTDAVHSRHYDVWFPVEDDHWVLRYNYAIDASWEPIPGYTFPDPVTTPGDWESNANQEEPFWVTADTMLNGLYFESSSVKGGTANLQVRIYDWQGYLDGGNVSDEISSLKFECPGGYDGVEMGTMTDPGAGGLPYATYEIELDGSKLLTNADSLMLLTIESANGNYQPTLTGYSGSAPLSYYRFMELPTISVTAPPPNDPPIAIATMDLTQVQVGTTVTFDGSLSSDPDGAIVSYEWDFDNDGICGDPYDDGDDIYPEVVFNTAGEYWIDLKVTDDDDASDNLDTKLHLTVTDIPNVLPVAIATSDKTDVEVAEPVTFNGTFSYDPDGSIALWEWDFNDDGVYGDGYDSGTDQSPVLSFTTAGDHPVDLRVTDNSGGTDTLDEELVISVNDPDNLAPVAVASVDLENAGVGDTLTFDGTESYDDDGTVDFWEWDFDNDGTFGDAYSGGTDQMPQISFATQGVKFINLRVTDNDGAKDKLDEKLVVLIYDPSNIPPVAAASVDKDEADMSETLTFDGTGSYDTDGTVDLWEWDFNNDGTFGDTYTGGTDQMPQISYDTPGVKFINLRVTDNVGATDNLDGMLVVIIHDPDNIPPVAQAVVDSDSNYTGVPFYFDASSSYDLDGTIVLYEWDFDCDGSYGDSYDSGTDVMPVKAFDTPGNICIGLRVWDNDGAWDILDETILIDVIEIPNELPVAVADVEPYEANVGETFFFDGSGSYDTDGFIVAWDWDFDLDGIYGDSFTGGTSQMPEISFDEPGQYCIDLRVTDDDGGTDTLGEPICVYVTEIPNIPPVADATLVGDIFFDNEMIEFNGEASYDTDGFITQWLWDFDADGIFGDPYDSGNMSHPFKYLSTGLHVVNLKVIDDDGAEDTLDLPFAFFVINGVSITLPEDQNFKLEGDWIYAAKNAETPADLPINPLDLNGIWDFTTISYPDAPDSFSVLPATNPEVASYVATYFPATTENVVKYGIVGSEYFGPVYIPEEPEYGPDLLNVYGFWGDNYITGGVDVYQFNEETGGEIQVPFPLDITMDVQHENYFPAIWATTQTLDYHEWAIGQGMFYVPYSGPLAGVALLTRTHFRVLVFDELAFEALVYRWLDDSGVEVARLYCTNAGWDINFNHHTYEIFGNSRLIVLTDE